MNYTIRLIEPHEYALLNDFLYEAIYIPKDVAPPDRAIIWQPELQLYVQSFGTKAGDNCLVAECDGRIIDAVWVRIMQDYGHIDQMTPSLSISLLKVYRRQGIGTALMLAMFKLLQAKKFKHVSLSVQKENYAAAWYQRLGFTIYRENASGFVMVKPL